MTWPFFVPYKFSQNWDQFFRQKAAKKNLRLFGLAIKTNEDDGTWIKKI